MATTEPGWFEYICSLKPGDQAYVLVELCDFPQSDMSQVLITDRGFSVRLWVPSRSIRPIGVFAP